jgi:hypothetical protein
MITVRKARNRGHFNHGWLDTYHTFSFADYYDPEHMGFRTLRVINEDVVAPGQGFGTHPHRDMEIVTYVLEGALEHRDSMGNGSVIRPGDVQRMSAGTGITHSEFNHSKTERVHLLQIWILPETRNLQPSYEQLTFSAEEKTGVLKRIASADGRGGSVTIHQNAAIYASILPPGRSVSHGLGPDRAAWVQVARGSALVNGVKLDQGDGASVVDERDVTTVGREAAEILLFDLG